MQTHSGNLSLQFWPQDCQNQQNSSGPRAQTRGNNRFLTQYRLLERHASHFEQNAQTLLLQRNAVASIGESSHPFFSFQQFVVNASFGMRPSANLTSVNFTVAPPARLRPHSLTELNHKGPRLNQACTFNLAWSSSIFLCCTPVAGVIAFLLEFSSVKRRDLKMELSR